MPCKILDQLGYEVQNYQEEIMIADIEDTCSRPDIKNTCDYPNPLMTSWGGNMFKISRVNDMPTTP